MSATCDNIDGAGTSCFVLGQPACPRWHGTAMLRGDDHICAPMDLVVFTVKQLLELMECCIQCPVDIPCEGKKVDEHCVYRILKKMIESMKEES